MNRECYGHMLPSLNPSHGEDGLNGYVFKLVKESHGLGRPHVELIVNHAQWKRCLRCELYRSCYDLSLASLSLMQAATEQRQSWKCEYLGPQTHQKDIGDDLNGLIRALQRKKPSHSVSLSA